MKNPNIIKKDTYHLNTNVMPTIPVPHDCVIKEIVLEEDILTFVFEDDITYHDSIKSICPDSDVKSLVIKFHLLDNIYDISMFVKNKTNRYHTTSLYKEIFLSEDKYALFNLPKNRLDIKIKSSDEVEDKRVIVITPHGKKYEDLCEAVL